MNTWVCVSFMKNGYTDDIMTKNCDNEKLIVEIEAYFKTNTKSYQKVERSESA